MFEATFYVSLLIKAINEYLTGEPYWIHPIHFGRSYLFLKKPDSKTIGVNTIGVTVA